jgi:hypothetical protein
MAAAKVMSTLSRLCLGAGRIAAGVTYQQLYRPAMALLRSLITG